MKKIIGIAVALLMTTGLFAKTWTNNIGVGFAVPINGFQIDESGTRDLSPQIAYDIQGMYLGYHENGFTVRGSLNMGVGTIKDLFGNTGDADNGIGFDIKENIGVGYSFVRSEKFVLALTGGMGLQATIFPHEETVGNNTTKTTATTLFLSLGGDLTGIVRFSPKFGMFFNINAGFTPLGKLFTEDKEESGSTTTTVSKDYNLKTTYTVTPSLGFVWTF